MRRTGRPLVIGPGTLELPVRAPFAFGQIVCAVNDSRGTQEAVHQATQLVEPAGTLTFVAVTDARCASAAIPATLDEGHAAEAVEAARAAAHADGIEATTAIVHAQDITPAILEAAHDAGLLVVGAHGQSRVASSLLRSIGARAAPRSLVPVLVARGRPELGFPGMALVGIQGIEDRHAAVVAATIAARHHTRVILAHAGRSDSAVRRALAQQAADVLDITGKDPVVVSGDGQPVERLLAMARSIGAGLVVLGSHGACDPRGLPSVSERVAHHATCSVLILDDCGDLPDRAARMITPQ